MEWPELVKRVEKFPTRHPPGSKEAEAEFRAMVLELLLEIAANTAGM